jgi:hypothetical protein
MLLLLAQGRLQLAPCNGVGGSPLLPLLLSLPPLLLLLLSVLMWRNASLNMVSSCHKYKLARSVTVAYYSATVIRGIYCDLHFDTEGVTGTACRHVML